MSFQDFLQALSQWWVDQLGKPVLMGAKGGHWFDPNGVRITFPPGLFVFDCSGLITVGIRVCGGAVDVDNTNAQMLYNLCPPEELAQPSVGSLGFYGTDPQHVEHVVGGLAGGHLISADGATHRITNLSDARAAGCQVRVHTSWDFRRDVPFLGWRSFPASLAPPIT